MPRHVQFQLEFDLLLASAYVKVLYQKGHTRSNKGTGPL